MATLSPPAASPTEAEADRQRLSRLRRMQALAGSLLVVAAVVYLLTRDGQGFWGYVNAGAEASMVGAIADWFAVTAIFRHPLGLPVPHTALVPRRKDEFGKSLEEFFAENFLQESVVRDRLVEVEPARRVGAYVADRAHAIRVVGEGAQLLHLGLERIREEDVRALVSDVVVERLRVEPFAPVAGPLLQGLLDDGAHHALVDLVLDEGRQWLVHNQDTFVEVLGERAPWWAPDRLNEVVTERLHVEAIRWLADIRADPKHHARGALDSLLAQLAHDLLHDVETMERAERLKNRMLAQPAVVDTGVAVWNALRNALMQALDDPEGPLRDRAADALMEFGERLGQDAELRARLDQRFEDLVVFAVQRYGAELSSVITTTIQRWDGHEAARKIELHVGPDLQFIRINGTIVGGLVGLVIHAVAQVLG